MKQDCGFSSLSALTAHGVLLQPIFGHTLTFDGTVEIDSANAFDLYFSRKRDRRSAQIYSLGFEAA